MKKLVLVFSILFSLNSVGQSKVVSDTIPYVAGNCEMCKERIEAAAYIRGVKKVEWDVDSKVLYVTYNTERVSQEKIIESIVGVGHSVGALKSSIESYSKLPGCCKYVRVEPISCDF